MLNHCCIPLHEFGEHGESESARVADINTGELMRESSSVMKSNILDTAN